MTLRIDLYTPHNGAVVKSFTWETDFFDPDSVRLDTYVETMAVMLGSSSTPPVQVRIRRIL